MIGVLVDEGDEETVHYFTDEQAADQALSQDGVQRALSLAGAWKDLDWDDALDQLDRIRHASRPTPPIDLSDLES